MNKIGDLGSVSSQLESVPKKAVDQLVKEPIEAIETAGVQAGAKPLTSSTTPQDDKSAVTSDKSSAKSDKDNEEFIKALYAKSDIKEGGPTLQVAMAMKKKHPDETPEEIKKMTDNLLRQHKEQYFNPTFNPPKRPEERLGDKIAREQEQEEKKKMDALALQEKEKREGSSPFIKQGTHEISPGVSG